MADLEPRHFVTRGAKIRGPINANGQTSRVASLHWGDGLEPIQFTLAKVKADQQTFPTLRHSIQQLKASGVNRPIPAAGRRGAANPGTAAAPPAPPTAPAPR